MSKPTATDSSFQAKIDQAKAEHGDVLSVVVDGELLMFRRPNQAELVNMNKASRKQPELAIIHAIGLCRNCYIGPGQKDEVDRFAQKYALLFAGTDDYKSISDHLIDMAKSNATITLS